MHEPCVQVGIVSGPQIEFTLPAPYRQDGREVNGYQTATFDHGRILWQGRLYDELLFEPGDELAAPFELHGVTIGLHFHWERKEDQRFRGALRIIVEDNLLTAVNIVRVEDYLTSVISSEMSATASLELLKAHAVISRSWLLANLKSLSPDPSPTERREKKIPKYQTADGMNYALLKDFQKEMKKDPTEAEKIVWNMLRNKLHIKPSDSLVRDTTRAYINAVQKNPIDILVHLNFGCQADAAEVAKCCRDYGTYLEISSKKRHLTDDELAAAAATGVRFVINSDAHSVDRIGDTALAMEQISRVGIPLHQIDNIEGRMPQLRLAEYKRRHL